MVSATKYPKGDKRRWLKWPAGSDDENTGHAFIYSRVSSFCSLAKQIC